MRNSMIKRSPMSQLASPHTESCEDAVQTHYLESPNQQSKNELNGILKPNRSRNFNDNLNLPNTA